MTPQAEASYNAADEMTLTRGPAAVWNYLADPLAEHLFIPLEQKNHILGVVALNTVLTAPRLLKPLVGNRYSEHAKNGGTRAAIGDILASTAMDASDGLDGATARRSNLGSTFGVGFDSFVDAVSLKDDVKRVRERAVAGSDTTVLRLLDIDSRIKWSTIALGGVANKASEIYVQRKGIVLEPREKAHSVPFGKAYFAAGATAAKILQVAYAFPDSSVARRRWRRAGIGMQAAAIGLGAAAGGQYAAAIVKRLRRLKQPS